MLEGERIARYRILRPLGAGATGTVYLAFDEEASLHVALKVLEGPSAEDERLVAAFRAEARASLELSHPNLVACLGADLSASPPWIAFEYVVGRSLAALIGEGDGLEPRLCLSLMLDIAYAVAAAHQKRIVHCDIKPTNLLVTANGTVKLIDFGAAHAEELPERRSTARAPGRVEASGAWAGTRLYASPEQLQGRDLDTTSDMFSLGLVFYEMLTGTRPIRPGTVAEIILQQTLLAQTLPRPSAKVYGIPKALDEVVLGLLAFQPRARAFPTGETLASVLEGLVPDEADESSFRRARRRLARRELAETDYWRAMNLLHVHKYQEAFALFRALVDLPPAAGAPYRERIQEDLFGALLGLHTHLLDTGAAFLPAYLAALGQVACLARDLACDELLLLVERRCVSAASFLKPSDRLETCSSFLSVLPASAALHELRRDTLLEAGREDEAGCLMLPLVQLYLEGQRHRSALALCTLAFREGPDRKAARRCLAEVVAEVRGRERALRAFRGILDLLVSKGHRAQAINACRRILGEYPRAREVYVELATLHLELGASEPAAEAFLEAGKLALSEGAADEARKLVARALRLHPGQKHGFHFLYEALCALGQLPLGFGGLRPLRLAVYCQEGIEEAALAALRKECAPTPTDAALLEALLPLASRSCCRTLEADILARLASCALSGSDLDAADRLFRRALAVSPTPLPLLEEIRTHPRTRHLFGPMEVLRLRRLFELRDADTLPRRASREARRSGEGEGRAQL